MKKKLLTANALLEFVLVAPVFLILISGMIETSILLYDKTVITNGSREGARFGVVIRSGSYASIGEVQSFTANYCANSLISFAGSPSVTVSAVPSDVEPKLGDTLTVTVNYQYSGLLSFLNFGQQYNLRASTVMPYE